MRRAPPEKTQETPNFRLLIIFPGFICPKLSTMLPHCRPPNMAGTRRCFSVQGDQEGLILHLKGYQVIRGNFICQHMRQASILWIVRQVLPRVQVQSKYSGACLAYWEYCTQQRCRHRGWLILYCTLRNVAHCVTLVNVTLACQQYYSLHDSGCWGWQTDTNTDLTALLTAEREKPSHQFWCWERRRFDWSDGDG